MISKYAILFIRFKPSTKVVLMSKTSITKGSINPRAWSKPDSEQTRTSWRLQVVSKVDSKSFVGGSLDEHSLSSKEECEKVLIETGQFWKKFGCEITSAMAEGPDGEVVKFI